MFAMSLLQFLIPWEPSIVLPMIFIAAGALYLRGACHIQVSRARRIAFWSGFALFYLALQTRVDYYAEHEFFADPALQPGNIHQSTASVPPAGHKCRQWSWRASGDPRPPHGRAVSPARLHRDH